MMKITIIDNGAGNLYNLVRFFERAYSVTPKVTIDYKTIAESSLLVLPGVGNFRIFSNIVDRVKNAIYRYIDHGGPLLAICLGMQFLFDESEEGEGSGLGIFKGRVIRIRGSNIKVPHIGWDPVYIVSNISEKRFLRLNGMYFYYAHSYHVSPEDTSIVVGITRYGDIDIPALIYSDNIVATQFHPERSGFSGLEFAKTISEILNLG